MMRTVAIFIDNSNLLYGVIKSVSQGLIEGSLDYLKLVDWLAQGKKIIQKRIYLSKNGPRTDDFEAMLHKNDFIVISKEIKIIHTENGYIKKCNFDVEMAIDIMDLIHSGQLPEEVIIISGDSDFAPLCARLTKEGACVVAVSTYEGLSHELKQNIVEEYFFLEDIWEEVRRQKRPS